MRPIPLTITIIVAASVLSSAFGQDDGHHYLDETPLAGDGSHHALIEPIHRGVWHRVDDPQTRIPYGRTWYARHLGAWSSNLDRYRWGNPWAFATLDSAATWLGMAKFHEDRRRYLGTYLTAGNNMGGPVQSTGNMFVNGQPDSVRDDVVELYGVEPSAIAAERLVQAGANVPPSGAQVLTLGVFTLAPAGEHESSVLVHLVVSRRGIVAGTLCDLSLDQDFAIAGSVDRRTGRVAWASVPSGRQVFDTSLTDLTLQSGPVAIHNADGSTSDWTIAHYEPLWAEDDPPYDANPAKTRQDAGRHPYSRFAR
jgi:hypothetical protein